MKSLLLKAHTEIEVAEDHYKHLLLLRNIIKSQYLNEIGYEFDRQRKCSMGWGFVIGAFICSTIYRRGSTARKAALFLLMGHLFGHSSYRINIDKYFDCVYPIFKEDANEFEKEMKMEEKEAEQSRRLKKNII